MSSIESPLTIWVKLFHNWCCITVYALVIPSNYRPQHCCKCRDSHRKLMFRRIQRVQNQLVRLVTKSPPFTRSLPLLHSLHWLLVRFRILFKIHLLTYRTLREKQPVCLHPILVASLPSCSLRSNDNSLSVPMVNINTGARPFHFCAPSLWSNLPLSVHSAMSVLQETSEGTSLWLDLSPMDTDMPDGMLMLRNCFYDFVVE